MKTIQFDPPEEFYNEEERSGYVVSSSMKKVWAVQIDLLEQLKQVCEKNGLTYFADSGTLLGAIRHKGYIPWDDDIDIVMKRSDYVKLIEIAPKEFKAPYFLQSSHSEVFPRGYARLRNSNTTAMTKLDLGRDFNHGIFIDIFPLDNVPDDLRTRKIWLRRIKFVKDLINVGVSKEISKDDPAWKTGMVYVCRGVIKAFGYAKMIDRYDSICSQYNRSQTENISYVAHSQGKKKHIWKAKSFESSHIVPFEYTTINIPDGYDSRLRIEYGDYLKPVHTGTIHGDVILDTEVPYVDYLREHSKEELERFFIDKEGKNS